MWIIGHRGAMENFPENTLKSFAEAIKMGVDWIELDVYLVDGEIIVIHDETLDRTTNSSGSIYSKIFKEIRELDAGDGEKIPTLGEVFDLCRGKVSINIELKGQGTAVAVSEFLRQQWKNGWKKEQILISSFNFQLLKEIVEIDPSLQIGVLCEANFEDALAFALEKSAFSVNPPKQIVSLELVDKIHKSGQKCLVYTVNSDTDILRMKDWNVDGVFTNFPEKAIQVMNF